MTETVELAETTTEKAKAQLKTAKKDLVVPSFGPKLLNGRWRAVKSGQRKLTGDRAWFTEKVADVILAQNAVGDQRDSFYTVRGQYGTKTIDIGGKKYPLKDEKVYDQFTGPVMENIQLLAGAPMQSLGIRAGPRGFIFAQDGSAYVPRKGITYNLDGSPVLYFDLADDGTRFQSKTRKVIHFEKAAGFERLTSGDISTMIETVFSTSQGQLSEAANKFLAQREKEGRQIYSVHDADAYGVQMGLLYGLASKNNAYMPSSFYAKSVLPLGLFPSIAQKMDLPPEDAAQRAMDLAKTNLTDMVKEKPDFRQDLDVLLKTGEQWEFQALNGVHEMASQVYLVEALRAREDEIKYVPPAAEIKKTILDAIKEEVNSFVNDQIRKYVENWFSETLGPELVKKLTVALESDVDEFIATMAKELPKLDKMDAEDLREAVKLKLVKQPAQYADRALRQVVSDVLSETFDIKAEIKADVKVAEASAEKELVINEPEIPDKPLTKDDISASIEKKMIRSDKAREEVVQRIRQAVETRFGKPDQTW